jgi:hypothetical protein
MDDACEWFDATQVITDEERMIIGRTNAMNYFNLHFLDE